MNHRKINRLLALLSVLIIVFGSYLTYFMLNIHTKRSFGTEQVKGTSVYQRPEGNEGSFLILGDSLAYGVGTSSRETSFAGKLGEKFPKHRIVNKAVVGYDTEDLAENIESLINERHDAIFIIVGGNDIIRYRTNLIESGKHLENIYSIASENADEVYAITTGDFNSVSMVPVGVRWHFSNRSDQLRESAIAIDSSISNLTYIDAYNINGDDYSKLESGDGFHLNDEGMSSLVDLTVQSVYK